MCHFVFGLLFAVWSVASLAVELGQDISGPKLDLLTVHLARDEFPNRRLGMDSITAGVVLVQAPNGSPNNLVTKSPPPIWARVESNSGPDQSERSSLHVPPGGDHPYLSPLLSVGSQGQRLNLRLRRHSLSLQYRLEFH